MPRSLWDAKLQQRRILARKSARTAAAGEALFKFLAEYLWEADFVDTHGSHGTDGYLEWPGDMRGYRLPVQVKSTAEQKLGKEGYRVYVEAGDLEGWAAQRPLLVLCVIEQRAAWWIDTADIDLAWEPSRGRTFYFPENQRVARDTKSAIQSLAVLRAPFIPPFVYRRSPRRLAYLPTWRTFGALRNISAGSMRDILGAAYREANSSVYSRDVTALAAARVLHFNLPVFGGTMLDEFLDEVSVRLFAPQLGGRSATLGALISTLRPDLPYGFDIGFLPVLERAAQNAVTKGTFLNPEFGLLLLGSLIQRLPKQVHLIDLLEHLLDVVSCNPQSRRIAIVSRRLRPWLGARTTPLNMLFSDRWLTKQIVQPLAEDAEVRWNADEAESIFERSTQTGPASLTKRELRLVNEFIQLKASYLLSDWAAEYGTKRVTKGS